MISPVFAPGGSRPLFGRRALTSRSSGRRSLPRPFRPLARSLPPTIAPPVPLSVWPRSAAFCCYPAALPLWRVARVRAFPAWWQALAPRLRGRLHITFSESWRPLLCVLAGRTAPGGSVRVESFAGGVRTSPAGWGAPFFSVCRVVRARPYWRRRCAASAGTAERWHGVCVPRCGADTLPPSPPKSIKTLDGWQSV